MTIFQTTPVSPIEPSAPPRSFRHRMGCWLTESRSHRVICLLAAIWLLNAFDLTLTILSHEQGFLQEQNPVAQHILEMGTPSIALFKIGLVLVGSYPLLRYRHVRITELASFVILFVYALLAARWSACYEMYSAAFNNAIDPPLWSQLHSCYPPR